MVKSIKQRLDVWQEEPSYWKYVDAIDKKLYGSSISQTLIELIKIRVSQINKCVFCIDYHTGEALQHGESARRIFALSAWQESLLFTDEEKAALQMAEEVTHISVQGLKEKTYERLESYFNTQQIAALIMCAAHINLLNRIGIATKTVPV